MSSSSFTCPVCGRTSHNPNDVTEQWCGACHGATGHPPPPGYRWVLFRGGGELDGVGRLVPERDLEHGFGYELMSSGDAYRFDGEAYVLVEGDS